MNFSSQSVVRDNQRSQHPLNKLHTTTGDFFRWDVVHLQPCVEYDVLSFDVKTFIDSAPNPYPINGGMNYGMYAFFVPNRLCWEDWKFYRHGLKDNLTLPYFTVGDLWDLFKNTSVVNPWREDYYYDALRYLSNFDNISSLFWIFDKASKNDIPASWRNLKLSAMPLRAMQQIWFWWMRDKMHISDAAESSYIFKTGGHITMSELVSLVAPKWRCYGKNYLTTVFDEPNEGGPVSAVSSFVDDKGPQGSVSGVNVNANTYAQNYDDFNRLGLLYSGAGTEPVADEGSTGDRLIGTQVNDLRYAASRLNFFEKLLVAGKTIMSRALAQVGIAPTIEELQMPNYLGGHEQEFLFDTTAANVSSRSKDTDPAVGGAGTFGYNPKVATFAGQKHMNATMGKDGFQLNNISYKTDEAGYFIVCGCITPRPQYFQGLPRNWTLGLDTFRSDRFDFFTSEMENQPLDPVLNFEALCDPRIAPKGILGFQEMYMYYKTCLDSIGGDFCRDDQVAQLLSPALKNMYLGRDIRKVLESIAPEGTTDLTPYLTPTVLTQSSGLDMEMFDEKFTVTNSQLDHFILNHKITLTMNRPMQSHCLPSLDSATSATAPKKVIDKGAFRL